MSPLESGALLGAACGPTPVDTNLTFPHGASLRSLLVVGIIVVLEIGVLAIRTGAAIPGCGARRFQALWGQNAARRRAGATDPLGETLLSLNAAGVLHDLVFIFAFPAVNGRTTGRSPFEERAGAQTGAFGTMDGLDAFARVKVGVLELTSLGAGPGCAGRCVIVVALGRGAVDLLEIDVGMVGTGTSQGHVRGIFREGLHGSGTVSFAVAAGVAGIKRAIMMEH